MRPGWSELGWKQVSEANATERYDGLSAVALGQTIKFRASAPDIPNLARADLTEIKSQKPVDEEIKRLNRQLEELSTITSPSLENLRNDLKSLNSGDNPEGGLGGFP
jgi:hypothetical protein